MINFNIDRETETAKCEIKGSTVELAMETLFMVKEIYKGINEQSEGAGKSYKKFILDMIDKTFFTDDELEKATEKAQEENQKLLKEIDNLLDTLRDSLNMRANNSEKRKKDIHDMDSEEFRRWLSEGDNE